MAKYHYFDLVYRQVYDQVMSRKKSETTQTRSVTFFCSKPGHRPGQSNGIWAKSVSICYDKKLGGLLFCTTAYNISDLVLNH